MIAYQEFTYSLEFFLTILFLLGILAIAFFYAWRHEHRKTLSLLNDKKHLEEEESHFFTFLRTLTTALENNHSQKKLHREIVEGITSIIDSIGGALYLLDDSKRYLHPAYLTNNCPPLTGLPVEILKKAQQNPKIIRSVIRLSKIPADEGILGSTLTSGIPQHLSDVKNHENFRDSFVHYKNNISALVAPLRYAGNDIGVIAITRALKSPDFSDHEFQTFRAACQLAALVLGCAKIHNEAQQKRSLESEILVARRVQNILLPNADPNIPGYRISAANKPAKIISGDYYDYIPLPDDKTAIIIADVSGKGVAAGILMAMCRSALRSELQHQSDPVKALDNVNKQIFADIREDMFISLALYVLNGKNGDVQLVCAGHDKAPLVRKDGTTEWIKPPGLALGLDDGDVFSRITKLHEFQLNPGDCLLLYTDGVTEAHNPNLDEYGAERMLATFKKVADQPPNLILEAILKDLEKFTAGHPQSDDITLIAIQKR